MHDISCLQHILVLSSDQVVFNEDPSPPKTGPPPSLQIVDNGIVTLIYLS